MPRTKESKEARVSQQQGGQADLPPFPSAFSRPKGVQADLTPEAKSPPPTPANPRASLPTPHPPLRKGEQAVLPPNAELAQASLKTPALGSEDSVVSKPPCNIRSARVFKRFCRELEGKTLAEFASLLLPALFSLLREPAQRGRFETLERGPLAPFPLSEQETNRASCNSSETWLLVAAVALNVLHGCRSLTEMVLPSHREQLDRTVLHNELSVLLSLEEKFPAFEWQEFFKCKSISYWGEEVKVSQWFTWDNISPALPDCIGSVAANTVSEGGVRYFLEHPEHFMHVEDAGSLPTPKVMVKDADWPRVVQGLLEKGVCELIREEDILAPGGHRVMGGLFGVAKNETCGEHAVLRLIMNCIPLNALFRPFLGDLRTLPMVQQFQCLQLSEDQLLLTSSEDVRCFFYIFEMPRCWRRLLAFSKRVPSNLCPNDGHHYFITSKVLPMGYVHSVAIAQHIHRNLVLQAQSESRLLSSREVRKDRPWPRGSPLWRIYLDNFDELRAVDRRAAALLQGELSPDVRALRREYQQLQIPLHPKKCVQQQPVAEVQGSVVDGVRGVVYPKPDKLLKFVCMAFVLSQQQTCSLKELQAVCGGLVFLATFRRPLLGGLQQVWSLQQHLKRCKSGRLPIPTAVRREILTFLALVPLAFINLRAAVSPWVVCSDASSSGGGVCCSTGVTGYGLAASRALLRGEALEVPDFQQVLAISLHDGISSFRTALDALGVPVAGYISVESDPLAQRVVMAQFQDVQVFSDIGQIDQRVVAQWVASSPRVSVVLFGAFARADIEDSFFSDIRRVQRIVEKEFSWASVHVFVAAGAGMSALQRAESCKALDMLPYLTDSSELSLCRQQSLFWVTWDLASEPGAQIFLPDNFSQFAIARLQFAVSSSWKPFVLAGWTPQNSGCLSNRKGEQRLLSLQEVEADKGFPVGYTNIHSRKVQSSEASMKSDWQFAQLKQAFHVPTLAWFLKNVLMPSNLCLQLNVSQLLQRFVPGNLPTMGGLLFRPPLNLPRNHERDVKAGADLLQALTTLMSHKGEDVLISASGAQGSAQPLRAQITPKLWIWREIVGWKWRQGSEHINIRELRALLTSVRWRLFRRHDRASRALHLVDNLVVLHVVSRGRSSSRRVQRVLNKLNVLLLGSGLHLMVGYVRSADNPADKPSRKTLVRKWAK